MLREEQIDLRRQRARATHFQIDNIGPNRVFSDYRVTNPDSGGTYTVTIRGFDVGDNACTCPDFKANTLGTCKHVEAVLEAKRGELLPHLQKKKAAVTRPELYLKYDEQVRLGLHLPPRYSDKLGRLAARFFDDRHLWSGKGDYEHLIAAVEEVPEEVVVRSDVLDFIDREVDRAKLLQREREWIADLEAGRFDPKLLTVPLYDYQARGAIFLACRGRSILGDDMGLGKTLQTLAAIELLVRERGIERVLVVAPASVKYQWEAEIQRFTSRSVQVIDGGPEERIDQYAQQTFYRLVNYEQVVRDRDAINDWKPDVIVLDEAQRIKNWESKTSKAVKKLQSRYAMVLTGTPLENKLEELYSIVQFVDERQFGPAFQFLHDHRVIDDSGAIVGYRNLEAIRERLTPIFLRRTRAEVLTQLPARTTSTRYVELTPEQRQPYEEQRSQLARLLQKNYLSDIDRKRVLAAVVAMRMLCDSTYLYDQQTRYSPKLDELGELLPELVGDTAEPHKIVIFSQWERMTDETARLLDRLGIGYTLLHGKMSGKERKASLETFKTDASCLVFLSTDAGATGLNLQSADTIVNLELPWNPAVLEQRIARVHRMGQKKPVRVIHFVTRDSIEERVLRVLESKRNLFLGLFEGEDDEITLSAINQGSFLQAVREVIIPGPTAPALVEEQALPPSLSGLGHASVQMIDSLAHLWEVQGGAWIESDPVLKARLRRALKALLDRLGPDSPEASES